MNTKHLKYVRNADGTLPRYFNGWLMTYIVRKPVRVFCADCANMPGVQACESFCGYESPRLSPCDSCGKNFGPVIEKAA